ncbi:MAG: hypothetical protein GIX03_16595 [Candidatus Eremiobacteraeota bacterium]|nr:hypothetical protein [Candidatus Eremiobacteraeota bacterium]MBC5804577.1 hypothetical protein [Candidatus Eremiobacteraeota bacterium]MBC5822789.1 hypothetical protein [Candidatus Eremiobacteraeota bacterium]
MDNFAPLASLDWQVHVYGEVDAELAAACARQGLDVHSFAWNENVAHADFKRDAAYLVRPDGYIAFVQPNQNATLIEAYIAERKLRS